jgi:hypothetical protein
MKIRNARMAYPTIFCSDRNRKLVGHWTKGTEK